MYQYQPSLFTGQELALEGLSRAVDHADNVIPEWRERVWDEFKDWLSGKRKGFEFMIEDFRAASKIEEPPSRRAYGCISRRAVKEGLVAYAGTGKVNNPLAHQARASVWRKI